MNKRMFFNHAAYNRTGGVGQRDQAFAACVDLTNRCNDVAGYIALGGPLDAPDVMPAGGCESYLWTNWKGAPLATVSVCERDA